MFIRPLQPHDVDRLRDIDGTIESSDYLHLEATGTGLAQCWRIEQRRMREKLIAPNTLPDDVSFLAKQYAIGADEGVALVSEYEDNLIGLLLAHPDPDADTFRLIDLRIDFDYRRQGLGSALVYQLITAAKERGVRAVAAESLTNNLPAAQFLRKSGFDLAGLDTKRHTNYDLVKESATLLWYASLT